MEPVIFHIDVNSAFLSWTAIEQLKNGSTVDLRTIPSIIGGDRESRHGIVLAKSTSAKTFGIKTGEPVAHALRKCESLVIARPDHAMYRQYSKQLMTLLRTFTPDIEQLSIDECFLTLHRSPINMNLRLPEPPLFLRLSKSNSALPSTSGSHRISCSLRWQVILKNPTVSTRSGKKRSRKLWPLPIEDLYMVGKSSSTRLRSLGITTIGELAHTDKDFLMREFKSHGLLMWEYANGIAPAEVHSTVEKLKGVGNSTTLAQDVSNADDAKKVLLALAEQVSSRLRKSNQLAQSVTVEIKYSTFQRTLHQKVLLFPTNSTQPIYELSCRLFDELWNHTPIRLLGIRTGKLLDEDAPVQMTLFDSGYLEAKSEKQQKLDAALDQIKSRYGENAVIRGSFFLKKKNPDYCIFPEIGLKWNCLS